MRMSLQEGCYEMLILTRMTQVGLILTMSHSKVNVKGVVELVKKQD
jgi:hypothetical protein